MISSLNSINTPDELLQAYTTMFMLLGSSVSDSPDETGLPSFCQRGLLRNLPVESKNIFFRNASQLLMSPCPHRGSCSTTITGNYHILFNSKEASQAKPVASLWINDKRTETVRVYYNRYGFTKDSCCDLEYDHLGIELLFINLLIEKYLTEDDSEIKEMIRIDLSEFISSEILSWVPLWAKTVSEKSITKCYTGIAGLVVGSLEDVRDILKT